MGRCIVKLDGKYLDWSAIVDAPVTYTMTLEELREYYYQEHGRRAAADLPSRLEQVERQGTSSLVTPRLEDLIAWDRASLGGDEAEPTLDEVIERYCPPVGETRG